MVPLPILELNPIMPLWSSTNNLQLYRPKPDPACEFLVVKKGSNILSKISSVIPDPLSEIMISAPPLGTFLFFAKMIYG